MAEAKTLDELNVPQEYRDRAKMMWIITMVAGFWGWIICSYVWKIDGQENNEWYQFQLKQALYVGLASWVGYAIMGLGFFIHVIFGLLGMLAIGGGKDYEAPVLGGMARK